MSIRTELQKTWVSTGFICDQCQKVTDFDTVSLSFGYGSSYDCMDAHFCSDECLQEATKDLKKLQISVKKNNPIYDW